MEETKKDPIKLLQMKATISQIKNTLGGISGRFVEERICELVDIAIRTT